jgi:hypothetical protein
MQPAGLAGDALELVVEADRIALQLCDVGIPVQCVKTTGGMPGRARGQLVALDQNDIGPAGFGQVVEHAATNDAAANHGNPGV